MTNVRVDAEGRYEPSTAVEMELKQFEKLRAIDPPITCADMAHRMGWTPTKTRNLLRKYRDNRK